jgi:two-component system, response regulator
MIISRKVPLPKQPSTPNDRSTRFQEPPPPEILLVEDSATDAELALRAFRRASIANPVTVVTNGEQALAYLFGTGAYAKRGPTVPLLILLDLRLPSMSGLDFLRQIKIDERTADIPVVTLSMTKSAPDIMMCLNRGVADHIIKPIEIVRLSRVLKQMKLNLVKLPPSEISLG